MAREVIVIGGWRAGKSTVLSFGLLVDIFLQLFEGKKERLLYWIVGPDYTQTDEEFRYLLEWCTKLGIVVKASNPNEGGKSLELQGNVHIETKSAAYAERLGSVAPDGIIVCEAGQVSEDVRTMLLGRTMEKTAWIRYAGTLEDDIGHTQWAWYQQLAHDWQEEPSDSAAAYALPSWGNAYIFGDCRPALSADPSLARFCPDSEHGPAHGGRSHPEIALRAELFDEYTFARRIAAIPTGVQYQVYPSLEGDEARARLLVPYHGMKSIRAAGGIDYGTVHPSAITVVTVDENQVAWVRESYLQDGQSAGDTRLLHAAKKTLSQKYNCWRWNTDPNERFLAKSYEAEAVSYSESSRSFRIGMVNTRLMSGGLMFDLNGPGVPQLYEEMRKVRRKKQKDGELKLVRLYDDRTAACEDAIEALDGTLQIGMPQPRKRKYERSGRVREGHRV